ncbi:TPA: hypothetical protein EYP13_00930 [Candidatus Micrarchaeota archaeon]|nr:hypothetical protein [Candidatus Micrarchaeota archaeon]
MELLRVGLDDPRPWKQAVDAISSFLPEGVFHFTEEGVRLNAIDPSQVVLVDFFAPRSAFTEYELTDSSIRVPLDLNEYTKIISRVSSDDRILMVLEDVNLSVVLERSDGTLRREFYLPLMDVPDREAEITPVEGAVTVRVLARVVKDALKDAGLFSSSAVLVAREDIFMVEAKGQAGVTRTVARRGPAVSIEGGPEAVSRYSLPFLHNIVRPADPDSFVELSFGNDTPLRISYRIGDVRLTFFLAHMIL